MSAGYVISTYQTGHQVTAPQYVDDLQGTLAQFNSLVEASFVSTTGLSNAIIYSGLNVTPGVGLTVNVSAGYARGADLSVPTQAGDTPITGEYPTLIYIPATTGITVPASSTGWIVILIDLTVTAYDAANHRYVIAPGTGQTTVEFLSVLPAGTVSPTFPSTYIQLAKVISGVASISPGGIGIDYDPTNPSQGDRAFDYQTSMAQVQQAFFPFTGFVAPYMGLGPFSASMSTTVAPAGWIFWYDNDPDNTLTGAGTIGNAASGGTLSAGNSALNLYSLIWNGFFNANCPVFTSAGAPTTRGASAIADFNASVRIALPPISGRVPGGVGQGLGLTSRVAGDIFGEENHALVLAENGPHNHGLTLPQDGVAGTDTSIPTLAASGGSGAGFTTDMSGSGTPHNTMQPSVFVQWIIKL